jgi:hypothetical protein
MILSHANRRTNALTLTEVLVIVVVVAVLIVAFLSALRPLQRRVKKINCVNNLKQIGIAFRIWGEDNGDKYPMQLGLAEGGVRELAATGNVAAVFLVMSNELSTPKVLVCPVEPNPQLLRGFSTNFGNQNVSYFIGLDATYDRTNAILTGDDNFEIRGVPVKAGVFDLTTNTPIAWTAERHNLKGKIGYGGLSFLVTSNSGLATAIVNQYKSSTSFTNRFRIAIP